MKRALQNSQGSDRFGNQTDYEVFTVVEDPVAKISEFATSEDGREYLLDIREKTIQEIAKVQRKLRGISDVFYFLVTTPDVTDPVGASILHETVKEVIETLKGITIDIDAMELEFDILRLTNTQLKELKENGIDWTTSSS